MDQKRKEMIKFGIAAFILFIIAGIVFSIVIQYQVNGETNMPFEVSKITIISTADADQNQENPEQVKWNLNIHQNNDIYFYITKNENVQEQKTISSVTIENFKILKQPAQGNITYYMPNGGEGRRFEKEEHFQIENSLTFIGAKESNEKNLTIGNQGGTIPIRIANNDVGKYISNEDVQVIHDATLLKLANVKIEEIQFSVSFDIVITIDNIKYKANVKFDFPSEDILENGITKLDILDTKDIVFKRE